MATSSKKSKATRITTLTLKLTIEQRERLRRVVESRATELHALTGQALALTASDIVRWLIDREAEARGIIEPRVTSSTLADTLIPTTVPMSTTERVPVSSTLPAVLQPLADIPSHGGFIPAEPTMLSELEDEAEAPTRLDPTRSVGRSRKKPAVGKLIASPDVLRAKVEDALSSGKIKQRELAEAAGVSRTMVSRFVRGGDVSPETLRAIAVGFAKLV